VATIRGRFYAFLAIRAFNVRECENSKENRHAPEAAARPANVRKQSLIYLILSHCAVRLAKKKPIIVPPATTNFCVVFASSAGSRAACTPHNQHNAEHGGAPAR
jgi:hypothetical protein